MAKFYTKDGKLKRKSEAQLSSKELVEVLREKSSIKQCKICGEQIREKYTLCFVCKFNKERPPGTPKKKRKDKKETNAWAKRRQERLNIKLGRKCPKKSEIINQLIKKSENNSNN